MQWGRSFVQETLNYATLGPAGGHKRRAFPIAPPLSDFKDTSTTASGTSWPGQGLESAEGLLHQCGSRRGETVSYYGMQNADTDSQKAPNAPNAALRVRMEEGVGDGGQ
mmetsp:Transcript_150088/g.262120  ORF Transcript_150088/g.262120 Transcript_150088/m.262120 type:complete len:109 (-) Transcript_150088:1650-1976(-)